MPLIALHHQAKQITPTIFSIVLTLQCLFLKVVEWPVNHILQILLSSLKGFAIHEQQCRTFHNWHLNQSYNKHVCVHLFIGKKVLHQSL